MKFRCWLLVYATVLLKTSRSLWINLFFFVITEWRISVIFIWADSFLDTFKFFKVRSTVIFSQPFLSWLWVLILSSRLCPPRIDFLLFRSFNIALYLLNLKVLYRWCLKIRVATDCLRCSWWTHVLLS